MRVFCKYYLKKLLLQVRIKKDLSFVVINPLNSKIFNILFQNNPDTVYIYPVLSGKYLSDTPFHYPILLNHGNNTFLNYTPEELEKLLQESQKNKFK